MTRGRGLCAWILVAGAVWTAPASGATGWTTPFDYGIEVTGTATAPDGTTVVWGRGAVQVRPPGGPVLAPQALSEGAGSVDVALMPDGGFMAAWGVTAPPGSGTPGRVLTAVMPAGATAFGDVRSLAPQNAFVGRVAVGVDAAGRGHVAWTTSAGFGGTLHYSTRPDGPDAPQVHTVDEAGGSPFKPESLALLGFGVAADGRVAVMWEATTRDLDKRRTDGHLLLARSGDGFALQTNILDTTAKPDTGAGEEFGAADLEVAPSGRLGVLWEHTSTAADGASTKTLRMRRGTIDQLGVEEDPAQGGGLGPHAPSAAIDDTGALRLAWVASTSVTLQPRAQTRTVAADGTRGAIQSFGSSAVAYTDATVETGPNGRAMLLLQATADSSCTYRGSVAEASEPFPATVPLVEPIATSQGACHPMRGSVGAGGDGVVGIVGPGNPDPPARGVGLDGAPPRLLDVTVPSPAHRGVPGTFSARAVDTWGAVTLSWGFGDGASATGAAVEHSYAATGERTVTVSATDALGNTATAERTVAVVDPPVTTPAGTDPAVGGAATVADVVRPRIMRLRFANRRLTFKLSEPATVRITFKRRGRKAGAVTRRAVAGANRVKVPRRLRAGRYRAVLIATDAAGNRSARAAIRFRVRG